MDLKKWFPFQFKRNKRDAGRVSEPDAVARVDLPAHPAPSRSPLGDLSGLLSLVAPDRLLHDPLSLFGSPERFFGDFSPAGFSPSIDITDQGDAIRVTAELPGLAREDLKLEVHEGMMLVSGHKQHEETTKEQGCYRTERYYGSFSRRILLPVDVRHDRANAEFKDGVLSVTFPKVESPQPTREIEIR